MVKAKKKWRRIPRYTYDDIARLIRKSKRYCKDKACTRVWQHADGQLKERKALYNLRDLASVINFVLLHNCDFLTDAVVNSIVAVKGYLKPQ